MQQVLIPDLTDVQYGTVAVHMSAIEMQSAENDWIIENVATFR